jgi:hypothetical protein
MDDIDKTYTEPKIVDYGDVREITAARFGHTLADATLPTGTPILPNSTGPCIGFGVPCT